MPQMSLRPFRRGQRVLTLAALSLGFVTRAEAQGGTPANGGPEWAAVQQALGGRGTMQPGGVLPFGFPRTDLQVTVDGVPIKAGLALGSWVAFQRMGSSAGDAIAMGDLVLTEDEVGPVMAALQGGVEQTALHHHVTHESPRILYMHVMAHGDPAKIARTIRTALAASATPAAQADAAASPPPAPTPLDLDTAAIARTLGHAGRANGGIYQVSVPRAERITDHGVVVPPSMGVATAINFQPTGGGRAAITGDFVMVASEVNPVIRALRDNGI